MSEILERVEAKYFIAERHIQQRFEDIDPPKIQQIDPVSLDLERIPNARDRDVDLYPSSLAYTVFTSGSTGKPKGIMHEHHAVAGGLQAVIKNFGLVQSTKFLQFADFAFDTSFCEILGPLVSGGQVCVPSEEQRVENLGSVMEARQVTDASLTPVVVNQLQASQVPHLRHLYIGGEAPSQSIIESWADHVRLSNIYGTSETGIRDTIRLEFSHSDNAKNISRGIDVNRWVVNPSDVSKLQPVGVKGEWLIQTPFLGRGYLGTLLKNPENVVDCRQGITVHKFCDILSG
ncbi:hypothetical protein N8T08_001343 [Aspergillus melleus]|uniref:Uncharacterized protein n=1 Tax=Aspergillus melleus TaxID=138277 RepID=A0ACC3AN75_9EURO|nr:hypothetical protein N8T08_001343 [Aspergillus melleus]